MSEINGIELQDQLTNLGVMLPIVFLTGHGDIPTSVRAIKAGTEDSLSKPMTQDGIARRRRTRVRALSQNARAS
jgi:FixJ family two-component response regulator